MMHSALKIRIRDIANNCFYPYKLEASGGNICFLPDAFSFSEIWNNMKIIHKIETYTSDGKPVLRFTVMNSSGAYMEFTNWGARWITASVPDVQGALANILIGYDTLSDYLKDSYYMGATVGRFANRIADASFYNR